MRITLEGDDRQTLVARLGLSSDASDADITAAVTNRILAESGGSGQPPADPPTAPATTPSGPQPAQPTQPGGGEGGGGGTPDPTQPGNGGAAGSGPTSASADDDLPEDGVLLDPEAYRALTARAARSDQLEEDARIQTRDTLIANAVRVGKFPPSRKKHYAERYDSDPDATTAQIERMAKNVVPVKERGVDVTESEMEASDAYPREWVHGGAPQAQATPNGNGGSEPRSRIHTED